jgi:hypothetical protein
MEKSWMPGLLDMLQPPQKNERPPEPEESESERHASSASVADGVAGANDKQWTLPTKEPASERTESAPFSFAGGNDNRWATAAKSPLEYEDWNESWSDRILSHAPAITVVVLLFAALGALSFFYRVQIGQSLVRLGEGLSGQSAVQQSASAAPNANPSPVQPTAPPVQSASAEEPALSANPSTPSTVDVPSAANADRARSSPAVSAKNSEPDPIGSSNDQAASGSRNAREQSAAAEKPISGTSADAGQAEFQVADAFLHQARTPADKARAAGLLWTAVSAGSSDAEVELADVYARGEGVRKNCQQARILLGAAQDKNNPLAAKESAELRVYGCR